MNPADRILFGEVTVNASLSEVWQAWTTPEGARTFFAPECRIELRVDGAYEMYFDPGAAPGSRGGEGLRILALQPEKMLSFNWNAPPELPEVRDQHTHVVVRFYEVDSRHTRVTLIHDGWGEGSQWDQAYAYFERAWFKAVLTRLAYRFAVGPVDWSNPLRLE